jgi:tetratricopeptide (TPR) repeat protein
VDSFLRRRYEAPFLFNAGIAAFRVRDYESAVPIFQIPATVYPSDDQLAQYLGHSLFHLEEWDEAIAQYERFIRIHPTASSGYVWRGDAYFQKADYEKSSEDYEKARELDPQSFNSYLKLGISYLETGKPEKAEVILRQGKTHGGSGKELTEIEFYLKKMRSVVENP